LSTSFDRHQRREFEQKETKENEAGKAFFFAPVATKDKMAVKKIAKRCAEVWN
jgi:hypothetical protein